jgi:hypothetical protein
VQIAAEHLGRDEPAVTEVLIVLLAAPGFLRVFQVLLVFWLPACLSGFFVMSWPHCHHQHNA